MTLPVAVSLGANAATYYTAAGSNGTPSWTQIPEVENETLNLDPKEVEVNPRGNGGWAATVRTLRVASLSIEMPHVNGNTNLNALLGYEANGTMAGFAVADANLTANGTNWYKFDGIVLAHTQKRDTSGALMDQFTIKPTWPNTAPPVQGTT